MCISEKRKSTSAVLSKMKARKTKKHGALTLAALLSSTAGLEGDTYIGHLCKCFNTDVKFLSALGL